MDTVNSRAGNIERIRPVIKWTSLILVPTVIKEIEKIIILINVILKWFNYAWIEACASSKFHEILAPFYSNGYALFYKNDDFLVS